MNQRIVAIRAVVDNVGIGDTGSNLIRNVTECVVRHRIGETEGVVH